MADPLRITVGSSTADVNPYAAFDVAPERYYDPVDIDPRSRDLVVRTIFGEAADKDEAGRAAVANVIRNRVASGRYGQGAEGVINKRWAFEPWMRPEARQRMLDLREDDPNYQSIARIVDNIFSGVVQDQTQGATHFYSPRSQAALARQDRRKLVPDWARGQPLANIGGHLFYAPEGAVRGTPSSPAPGRGGAEPPQPTVSAPPSIQPDDRVQLAALAQNTAVPDNPYAQFPSGRAQQPAPAAPPPFEGPMPPDIGYGGAASAGLQQGASLGFADELRGAHAAGREVLGKTASALPGLTTLIGTAVALRDAYLSNPNPKTKAAFDATLARARQEYAQAKEQYPWTTGLTEVAGGIALPLPGGALTGSGRALGTRIAGGALQGGVAGGVTGAGQSEGDLSQRAASGALGTVVGAGLGGTISAAAPAIANTVGHTLRGLFTPKSRAEALVAQAARRAEHTSPTTRVTQGQATPDTVVADILGEPGRRLAQSAKIASPEAGAHLQEFTMDRAREQYPRLVDFIEAKVGPISDNALDKLKVQAEAAQVNNPLYRQVMDLNWQGISSPRLIDLLQRHSVVGEAAKKAMKDVGDRAVVEGRATPGVDSLEFWDQVKRNIGDKISGAMADPEKRSSAQTLTDLSKQLIKELDDLTGSQYATARSTAAGFKKIEQAIDDGKKFVGNNQFTTAHALNQMRGMSDEAKDAFRRAGINELMRKLSQKTDTHDLWKSIYNSRDAQQKMHLLFNNDQNLIREFEALHHIESVMQWLKNKVHGGSDTAEKLIGYSALAGSVPVGALTGDKEFNAAATGGTALSGLALLGHRHANQRVAEHVARLLTSNNPQAIEQVTKAAAGNATVMDVIRKFAENASIKTLGAQSARYLGD